jgi:hypothetical protein
MIHKRLTYKHLTGKDRDMHKHVRARKVTKAGGADKAMAFGILERGGQVRTMVLPDRH